MVRYYANRNAHYYWTEPHSKDTESVTARTVTELFTGGKAVVGRKSLVKIHVDATEYGKPPGYGQGWWVVPGWWYATPSTNVNPVRISVLGWWLWGYELSGSGDLYRALPDDAAMDLKLRVFEARHYSATPSVEKYELMHLTKHPALTDTNLARLNLGVGEEVNCYFTNKLHPGTVLVTNPLWSASAGGFDTASGLNVWFTAPSNAANATVTASFFGVDGSLKTKFKVFEPSGYDPIHTYVKATNHIGTGYPDAPYEFASGRAGAEMLVNLFIAPTSVSFYRVQILEIGLDATNVTGYFTNYPANDLVHKPNPSFTLLLADNSWPDKCWEGPEQPPPPAWSSGSYTWIIPAKWSLSPDTVTNPMTGWDQVFTIDSNGTVKITKYGKWVQRTTSGVITNN